MSAQVRIYTHLVNGTTVEIDGKPLGYVTRIVITCDAQDGGIPHAELTIAGLGLDLAADVLPIVADHGICNNANCDHLTRHPLA